MTPRCLRVAGDPNVTAKPPVVSAGDPVRAVVHIRLAPTASRPGFEQHLRTLTQVMYAWQVIGEVDYELLVTCSAIAELVGVLTCLRRCGAAEVTSTGLVLREVSGRGEASNHNLVGRPP
jgi:hypothetical protein